MTQNIPVGSYSCYLDEVAFLDPFNKDCSAVLSMIQTSFQFQIKGLIISMMSEVSYPKMSNEYFRSVAYFLF